MVGTYHQFGSFISGVASLPRVVILTMHDISLKPQRRGKGIDATAACCPRGHGQDLPLPGRRRRAPPRKRSASSGAAAAQATQAHADRGHGSDMATNAQHALRWRATAGGRAGRLHPRIRISKPRSPRIKARQAPPLDPVPVMKTVRRPSCTTTRDCAIRSRRRPSAADQRRQRSAAGSRPGQGTAGSVPAGRPGHERNARGPAQASWGW